MIPKRLFRIWLGPAAIPALFETWWQQFEAMHPAWEVFTLRDDECLRLLPASLRPAWNEASCYAARSDIARYAAIHALGGIYIDADFMPLRPLDELLDSDTPFAGLRSRKSFESAILGSPRHHQAAHALINALPGWFIAHRGRSASVQTGPAFLSSVWFGRADVRHLPSARFYPHNGFMAPSLDVRMRQFTQSKDFPPEMLCAHFCNHRWGGRPKDGVR